MKCIWLIAIACTLFLVGCNANVSEEAGVSENVNLPDLKTKIFEGNYVCAADIVKENVFSWVEEDQRQDENLQTCIENQANAKCYLLYAMYNNRIDLCDNFPEEQNIEYYNPPSAGSGSGEGYEDVTCHYKEICKTFVRIFNEN